MPNRYKKKKIKKITITKLSTNEPQKDLDCFLFPKQLCLKLITFFFFFRTAGFFFFSFFCQLHETNFVSQVRALYKNTTSELPISIIFFLLYFFVIMVFLNILFYCYLTSWFIYFRILFCLRLVLINFTKISAVVNTHTHTHYIPT